MASISIDDVKVICFNNEEEHVADNVVEKENVVGYVENVVSNMEQDAETSYHLCKKNVGAINFEGGGSSNEVETSRDMQENEMHGFSLLEEFKVDCGSELQSIEFCTLTPIDVMKYHFANLDLADEFYHEYAKNKGFAIRKSKVGRNKERNLVRKTFLCFKEGFRQKKHLNRVDRKHEAKPLTRCGCNARIRVRLDPGSNRWCVKFFSDEHNHELLSDKYVGMLAGHRKMKESDILQMKNLRDVGISTPYIFGSFVKQSGGFKNVDFNKRDMYNQIKKERRTQAINAKAAITYINRLRVNDPTFYFIHIADGEGRLENPFWAESISQVDYHIFGDVLAFDATYRRNKYMCPLVVFSGVNHHSSLGTPLGLQETFFHI
ncbi:FAR1 DNA-binding domain [Sesbania bispinosa]|nr:FAR1 DNA-binding domain [Sesbania bispinosa]